MKPENDFAGYPALKVNVKTGEEHFQSNGQQLKITLLDFWRWSASDLVNNALRGQLAEYIVAQAISVTPNLRVEWDSYDLLTNTGIRIEVKSAAYLQSWYHKKLSPISFQIRQTIGWNSLTNTYETEKKRQADIYVFCLLDHKDKNDMVLNIRTRNFFNFVYHEPIPTTKTKVYCRV